MNIGFLQDLRQHPDRKKNPLPTVFLTEAAEKITEVHEESLYALYVGIRGNIREDALKMTRIEKNMYISKNIISFR